jgi:hypothetical protein
VETSADPSSSSSINPSEYVERLVRCIRSAGGEVDVINSVTISARPGPGMSDEAMQQVMSICRTEAGPPPERRVDESTAKHAFAELLKVRECLVDLGYQPEAPPSEETFIEPFGSEDVAWHPYDGLNGQFTSYREQIEVEEKCPPWVE